jgi:hypothetical protein
MALTIEDLPTFGLLASTTAGQSNHTTGALRRLRCSSIIPVYGPLIRLINAFHIPSFASLMYLYASLVLNNNLTLVTQSLESWRAAEAPSTLHVSLRAAS